MEQVVDIIIKIVADMIFAAIAAVGFSAISHPPKGVFIYCALIAAIGHAVRFCLINFLDCHPFSLRTLRSPLGYTIPPQATA